MADSPIALVTGAGSGVGYELSLLLAREGYTVALVGRTQSKLEATAQAIAEQTDARKAAIFPCDLCDGDAVQQLVADIIAKFGRLDAIANVAGYALLQPVEKTTQANWRATIDTNLTAPILITTAAWPIMKKQGAGVIVNVSSMAANDPFPGFGLYAPSKAGLDMFTHCAGLEGKKVGIRIGGIGPGAIETQMLRDMFDEKMLPKDKTLSPAQVAQLVCDMMTGKHPFEPGETIPMPSP